MITPPKLFQGMEMTINTTEDCNLRCTYCYETCKKPRNITYETCKKFIDLMISSEDKDPLGIDDTDMSYLYDGLIISFIGGDSLMHPKLLDKVLQYFQYKLVKTNHKAKNNWRCSISTNGTLFVRKDVRDFCEKWQRNLSIGVSIDGCPEIHDMNRIFPNGKGSMNAILKGWDWYRKTFPTDSLGTKATSSRNAIPYIYDSLKWMHEELGLKYIYQNFIMEDTGATEEDYILLDKELEKCKDYILDHKDELYWSMLDQNFTISSIEKNRDCDSFYKKGHCGSGLMPALSIDGNIYPCFRWLPTTQNGNDIMRVGDIENGFNKKENFKLVQKCSIRTSCTRNEECRECELEPVCPYCIAGCYQEYGDFIRQTHVCRFIKLQNKWAEIYWKEYNESK